MLLALATLLPLLLFAIAAIITLAAIDMPIRHYIVIRLSITSLPLITYATLSGATPGYFATPLIIDYYTYYSAIISTTRLRCHYIAIY